MLTSAPKFSRLHSLWNVGQQHLAGGRYVSAASLLAAAESIAWRLNDLRSLARIHLPLLEARRQIRQNAADGALTFLPAGLATSHRASYKKFLAQPAGTLLILCSSPTDILRARLLAQKLHYATLHTGHWLESLIILAHKNSSFLATATLPTLRAALPITWTTDPQNLVGPSTDPCLTIPIPPPSADPIDPLHALARESLLIAWEALALRFQHQHPPLRNAAPRDELAWLRKTLTIDPACEPVVMRLIALAEAMDRRP